jgi:hypothetical protein
MVVIEKNQKIAKYKLKASTGGQNGAGIAGELELDGRASGVNICVSDLSYLVTG